MLTIDANRAEDSKHSIAFCQLCIDTCVLLQVCIVRSCDQLVYGTQIHWIVSYIAVIFDIIQGAA